MGDEIRELEQRIIDLLEQVHGDELNCEGIRCEQCLLHQSNLYVAARGFVKKIVYERGEKVIADI